MKISRTGLLIAAALPLAMLLEYYSFVIHMHQAFGGWPPSIGVRGFSPNLLLHSHVTEFVAGLCLCTTGGAFLALVTCGVLPRCRRFAPYPGCCLVFCVLTLGLTQLAPAGFLNWWYD